MLDKRSAIDAALLALSLVSLAPAVPANGTPERIAQSTETVYAADAFVDSEGINTQFSRITYARDPALPELIARLRLRHLRDGIEMHDAPDIARLNHVAAVAGIRYDLITDGGKNAFGGKAQTSADIAAFVRAVPSTEAIEAPNEYDTRCCAWQPALTAFLPTLRAANTQRTIVGPAFTSSYAYDLAGDLSADIDVTNVHNYFSGFPPETAGWGGRVSVCGPSHRAYCGRYGSLQYSIGLANVSGPAKPIYSTETGYGTTPARNIGDAVTQGKYIPRLLFNQFANGIERTYLFQLVDYHSTKPGGYASYGLLAASPDYTSHTPKPAYLALAKINELLNDPGPAFSPAPLAVHVEGEQPSTETVLLEKRDGTYFLAIWSAVLSYDVNGLPPGPLSPDPHTVTLRFDVPMSATAFAFADDGTEAEKRLHDGRSIDVNVTDRVTLVRLRRV